MNESSLAKEKREKFCEGREMKLNLIMKNTRKLKGGLLITLKITSKIEDL